MSMSKKYKLIRLTTIDGSLWVLLKGQLRFLSAEFEVVGVADDSGRLAQVAEREGVRTVAVPMRREISLLNDVQSLILLIRLFRKEKPYIVHANTPKASLLGMLAARITGVPHRIYLVTGLRFETACGLFRWVLKTMERITCACATKVIPEGDGVAATVRRERITRKPLRKILNGNINGVDLGFFDRLPEVEIRARELGAGAAGNFSFVFVGRLVKDKGINELVQAFVKLNEVCPHTRLCLVGTFEDRLDPVLPQTRRWVEEHPSISAVGYQSDVRPYMAASNVLVLPSYREGFPNVVLQAGAMGLPCIVTDINGCNEAIVDGVNGRIVPKQDADALFDAMKGLVENREAFAKMAGAAREMIASRYAQPDVWKATLEMYKNLQ